MLLRVYSLMAREMVSFVELVYGKGVQMTV